MALSADEIRRLARLGAVARLQQLRDEEAAIRAEFPELFGRGRRGAVADRPGSGVGRKNVAGRKNATGRKNAAERKNAGADLQVRLTGADSATEGARTRGARRRRRHVSAAARKAASERMRRYWAERRKTKAAR